MHVQVLVEGHEHILQNTCSTRVRGLEMVNIKETFGIKMENFSYLCVYFMSSKSLKLTVLVIFMMHANIRYKIINITYKFVYTHCIHM